MSVPASLIVLGTLVVVGCGARPAPAPPPSAEPAPAPPCHRATAEEVAAGVPAGLDVCGSVTSGNYSYSTAGSCTCQQVFVNHVRQAPRCMPCASYVPPPPPQRPQEQPVADSGEISVRYVTPPDGCPTPKSLPRDGAAHLFGGAKALPRYTDACDLRDDDVPDADSDFQLLVVPLEGRAIAGFSVHEGVLTVSFEPVECAGGERVPTAPSPGPAPAPAPANTLVPNGRPLFKVPRSVKKVVLVPPAHRVCPPAAFAPGRSPSF